MLSALTLFYGFALLIGLLHLGASAIITRKRMKDSDSFGVARVKKDMPKVTILKPLKGLDDELEENLRSFFRLDYPNYEIVFGLNNGDDPAFKVVRKLVRQNKHIDTHIVVSDFQIGLNPKINNMFNMSALVWGDFLLISDSNTRVEPDFLKKMMDAIQEPGVGLVTATIRGMGAKRVPAIMENLHINSYVSPNVFVADSLSGIPVVIGKSILLSRKLLEKMGGFAAFKNYLAEDYLLGLRTKEFGLKVKTIPVFVNNINANWSFKRFVNRHTRWAKMRRNLHLHHYLIESFSNPIALATILAMLLPKPAGFVLLMAVVVIKMLHDIYVSGLVDSDLRWYHYLLIPVKDLLIGVLWWVPFFSNRVNWRENFFRIGRASQLEPVTS